MSKIVCTSCGYIGEPGRVTNGSIGIELILWLCLLVPGLIYSIWRLSTRHDACPSCGNAAIIPAGSPMARKFLRENMPEQAHLADEPKYQPSKGAQSAGRVLGQLVGKVLR